jgi:alkylation response protein AidB-like acyl-CoA dehydrogenase
MNFQENETIGAIREMVRDFAAREMAPHIMDWDERQHFPRALFGKMGELGLMGMLVPDSYGGTGLGYFEYAAAIEELAAVCGSIGLSMAAHNSLCTNHILSFGSEDQKQRYLPKLASGEHIGAWGLTEAGTGSDAMRMQCTATRDGEDWVINGTKNWITHGISGDVVVVLVRTGELLDSRGISAFIVERGTPGFKGGKKENKLGMRSSETAELIFEDCRIPAGQMLGEEGEREQFGRPIAQFQGIGFKLADMAVGLEASRGLIDKACHAKMTGGDVTRYGAMAKYMASEECVRISTDAVQVFGGYGYTKDFPVEKFYRDSKLCTIGEGTSEIQKLVISRGLLANGAG